MRRLYQSLIANQLGKHRQMLFLMGPRQVGKTTLSLEMKEKNSDFYYFNWDNLDDREILLNGPKAIADQIGIEKARGKIPIVVFDEIHKYKDWKTLLKGFFDSYSHKGELKIIVTGSARLETFNSMGDSLMGRYLRYRIHPLSVGELLHQDYVDSEIRSSEEIDFTLFEDLIHFGGFPEPFLKKEELFIKQWQQLRQQQLFREEVRNLTKIHEIGQMELLAVQIGRQIGMLSNYTNLANKIRISIETVRRWLSALSALYYCYVLRPWSKNISRSLLKEPKIYLWDWSLVEDQGARAENFIGSHLLKAIHFWTDRGFGQFGLYFLRDKEKREVDFIVTKNNEPWFLVEVKNGNYSSLNPNLEYFQEVTQSKHAFQVVMSADYEDVDCFSYTKPVIVPASTFLSQLV